MVTDASFDGEAGGDGIAESTEDGIDFIEVAEQSTASVFAADDGSGATKVQVDAGDRIRKELGCDADEARDVAADELGEDGALGGVLGDGFENIGIERRVRMDAKELGDEPIWGASFGKSAHEWQVGNILHRSQYGGWPMWWNEVAHRK